MVEWFESEWDEDPRTQVAVLNGIEAVVGIIDGEWSWSVKPTSSRCEYQELYDSGYSKSEEGAKRAAASSIAKADRSYGIINYD